MLGKSVCRRGSDGSGMLPGISSTTGGHSTRGMQEVVAASGGSAPTSNLTSGRAVQVEGSEQGLTSHLQRSELLYRGQSMSNFCLDAQRATQRSSLDEIAVSK